MLALEVWGKQEAMKRFAAIRKHERGSKNEQRASGDAEDLLLGAAQLILHLLGFENHCQNYNVLSGGGARDALGYLLWFRLHKQPSRYRKEKKCQSLTG